MGAHDFGDHTVFTKADNEPPEEPKVNWGFNCLTSGVHHGRPEVLWSLPLLQAVTMFDADDLKTLVISRIYTDALIFVHRGEVDREITTQEWADRVKELAEERYDAVLQALIEEISKYYNSPMCKRDQRGVVARVLDNRLNPHYQPLHGHDSVNMLCRIIGVRCSGEAADRENH